MAAALVTEEHISGELNPADQRKRRITKAKGRKPETRNEHVHRLNDYIKWLNQTGGDIKSSQLMPAGSPPKWMYPDPLRKPDKKVNVNVLQYETLSPVAFEGFLGSSKKYKDEPNGVLWSYSKMAKYRNALSDVVKITQYYGGVGARTIGCALHL